MAGTGVVTSISAFSVGTVTSVKSENRKGDREEVESGLNVFIRVQVQSVHT